MRRLFYGLLLSATTRHLLELRRCAKGGGTPYLTWETYKIPNEDELVWTLSRVKIGA